MLTHEDWPRRRAASVWWGMTCFFIANVRITCLNGRWNNYSIWAQCAVMIICVNRETGITEPLGKGKVTLPGKFRGNRWKPFRFDCTRNKRPKAEYHICKFFWFCFENQNKLAVQVLTYAPHKWHTENFSQRWPNLLWQKSVFGSSSPSAHLLGW